MCRIIREEGFRSDKIEFLGNKMCIGNGYFGYRGTLEEYGKEQLVACTVSEVFDDNGNGWREPVNVPNGLYSYVVCDGEKLSVCGSNVKKHIQELDIFSGTHYRKTIFETTAGKEIKIESERFASLSERHLLVLSYKVTANDDMTIEMHTGIDTEIWDINGSHFCRTEYVKNEKYSGVICETIQNHKKIAVVQCVDFNDHKVFYNETGMMQYIKMQLKAGESYVFKKYVAICKETDCEDVLKSACKCAIHGKTQGYEELLKKQKKYWKQRYDNLGIEIQGDEEAETAILYSCYLLYSSAPEHTDHVAIPARGLSGQVYKGAMFWDTEIYMLPLFTFCEPEIAKNLVMYRVRNLEGAREKAAEYGYQGAFYPWESQENGKDGCTHYNLTDIFTGRKMRTYFRDKQIHISADVVYGLWKYMEATKDYSILLEGAAEVILECARFFYSYAYFKKDKNRYEFLDVTGADEYHERVNNDAYTNYMIYLTAKVALFTMDYMERECEIEYKHLMEQLDYWKDIGNIKDMYEKIYLPEPDVRGVIEQYDGYFKQEDISIKELYSRIIKPNEYLGSPCGLAVNTQVIKQADVVLLLSLFGNVFSDQQKERNWSYYEPRTEHGSSLSTCIYALLAAQIGKTEWAYKFLMKAAQIDLTGDYKLYLGDLYIGGTHPAANGGTWMVVVQGFAGFAVTDHGVSFNPHLPSKWKQLRFCFKYCGVRYSVTIRKNDFEIISKDQVEEPLNIHIKDRIFTYRGNSLLKIQL